MINILGLPPDMETELRKRMEMPQEPAPDRQRAQLPEAIAERLLEAFDAYSMNYDLRPRMIVRQKKAARLTDDLEGDTGLRVVIEFLEEPIIWDSQSDDGPPNVRLRFDMLLGHVFNAGKHDGLICLLADSRRFEPVTDVDLAQMGR